MATEAQVVANRLNAQKSTGPRTVEGKATASQNAVKHGLRAEHVVIRGEDPGEFEFYREQVLSELAPSGAMESILAERVAGLAWRLRRAERIQAEVFDAMLIKDETSPVAQLVRSMQRKTASDDDRATALGEVVVKDFANSRVLDRLGMYERRIEHSLYRTVAELRKLRLLRELDEATPPEAPSEPAESQFRQTNPISPAATPKTALSSPARADKGRSSLTTRDPLRYDPPFRGAEDRAVASPILRLD